MALVVNPAGTNQSQDGVSYLFESVVLQSHAESPQDSSCHCVKSIEMPHSSELSLHSNSKSLLKSWQEDPFADLRKQEEVRVPDIALKCYYVL